MDWSRLDFNWNGVYWMETISAATVDFPTGCGTITPAGHDLASSVRS